MGSVTMAVKLILVSWWCSPSPWPGPSSQKRQGAQTGEYPSGGFQVGRKLKALADILEKRKQLFQRNPTRRRNFGKVESRDKNEERGESLRVRTTTTTEAYVDEIKPPFKGVSEVRT